MFGSPRKSITGGSLASASNLPSLPRCRPLTVCTADPTLSGEMPDLLEMAPVPRPRDLLLRCARLWGLGVGVLVAALLPLPPRPRSPLQLEDPLELVDPLDSLESRDLDRDLDRLGLWDLTLMALEVPRVLVLDRERLRETSFLEVAVGLESFLPYLLFLVLALDASSGALLVLPVVVL